MCRSNAVVVLSLFLISFCDLTSSECTQLAPCVCSLPDGYYYNLTGLANAELLVANQDHWTAYFHPCTNVKMKNTTCSANETEVSLCMMYNTTDKNKTLTGKVEETQMKLSTKGPFPIFEIGSQDGIKLTINIVCFPEDKTSFSLDSASPESKNFFFKLVSPYGCKIAPEKGLSTGSVLVIFFFVIAGVYFIGGIIVLRTLRGATGWEMVPNHDFWCKLPSLVRDGVVFTFNCCRADSYERI
ncbi:uncharacterized protein [Temnothorax nylanderi]|uniref:uncharacterized protein n=1 Tax=Temnothorax nylanderi TaxID=102681 RepID=UPI003A8C7680